MFLANLRATENDARRPIRIGDGHGLYLQRIDGAAKSWLLRYTLRGKAREMGLGPVGEPPAGVSFAKARTPDEDALPRWPTWKDGRRCRMKPSLRPRQRDRVRSNRRGLAGIVSFR